MNMGSERYDFSEAKVFQFSRFGSNSEITDMSPTTKNSLICTVPQVFQPTTTTSTLPNTNCTVPAKYHFPNIPCAVLTHSYRPPPNSGNYSHYPRTMQHSLHPSSTYSAPQSCSIHRYSHSNTRSPPHSQSYSDTSAPPQTSSK